MSMPVIIASAIARKTAARALRTGAKAAATKGAARMVRAAAKNGTKLAGLGLLLRLTRPWA
ncbi:MAG: hypothetical protein P4L66_02900 [Acetobacteraceae bacterium]|nr:hypothetical protein [Acetobacteraceae bacterium]